MYLSEYWSDKADQEWQEKLTENISCNLLLEKNPTTLN